MLDNGSAYMTIENNVIEDCANWLFGGGNVGIIPEIGINEPINVSNNYSDTGKYVVDGEKEGIALTGNTTGTTGAKAQAIKNNAGIETDYQYLYGRTVSLR